MTPCVLTLSIVSLLGGAGSGQSRDGYALEWHTVDGGGRQYSEGGEFKLAGTIGQHDAGAMIGGEFTVAGAFWKAPCRLACDCHDFDVCTCDLRCMPAVCSYPPALYGDVDCNGTCGIYDIFCVLNCFGGYSANCCCEDADITGNGNEPEDCGPNGAVTIFDLFAVLDCFGGIDPCCSEPP